MSAHFSGTRTSGEKTCDLLILLCETKSKKKMSGQSSGCKKRATLLYMSLNVEIRVASDVDLKNYLRMTDECFESFASFAEASH
jgi:hypothetical protein